MECELPNHIHIHFLYKNTRRYIPNIPWQKLLDLKLQMLIYMLYSLDIALSEYYPYLSLSSTLLYNTSNENYLNTWLNDSFCSKSKILYPDGI